VVAARCWIAPPDPRPPRRGSLQAKAKAQLKKKPFAFAPARRAKCASRKKTSAPGESVFFISPQTRTALRENALHYDEGVSGSIIYTYVEGNPISRIDPLGLMGQGAGANYPGPRKPSTGKIEEIIEDVKRVVTDPQYNECVAKCQQAKASICGFISIGATGTGYMIGGLAGIPLSPESAGTSVVAGAEIGAAVLGTTTTLVCSFSTDSCLEICKVKEKQCK